MARFARDENIDDGLRKLEEKQKSDVRDARPVAHIAGELDINILHVVIRNI